jgi:hypothetical protein
VKLHGSVDWGYRLDISGLDVALSGDPWAEVNDVVDVYAQRGFPNFSSEHIQLLQQGPLEVVRQDRSSNRAAYYPALALPLGPADEIVCPSSHIDAAKAAFARMDGLNLLVIGYSGLDEEVLRLFSESKNSIRRMLVANGDDNHTGAQFAADRIANAFNVEVNPAWVTEYGFSSLVETGALRRWMSEVA